MLRFLLCTSKHLSLNDLTVALLNYIKAQQTQDRFLMRINDIYDNTDNQKQITKDILKKFAIDTQNSIYQSKNISIYEQMAKRLVDSSKAYACFCNNTICDCSKLTANDVQTQIKDGKEFLVKIKKPQKSIFLHDNLQGNIALNPEDLEDFVILQSNGKPTATFANAIDDMTNGVTAIIESITNLRQTHKTIYIQELLGYENRIDYYHIPQISYSKSIINLLEQGYLPDAIINYLFNLTGGMQKKFFYLPEAIESFDLNQIKTKSQLEFSLEELNKLNKQHLAKMDSKKLSQIVGFADSDIGELLKLFLDNATTINDLQESFKSIFSKKDCTKKEKELSEIILTAPYFKEYNTFKNYLLSKSKLDPSKLEASLTKLIIGKEGNFDLEKIYNYIKSYLLEVVQCQ